MIPTYLHQQAAYLHTRLRSKTDRGDYSHAFGMEFKKQSLHDVARSLAAKACLKIKTRVSFVNAHCINEMHRDSAYNQAVRSSNLILPDGSGMALATSLNCRRACTNLNGTDLAPELMKAARDNGLSVYFLGARPGVARTASEKLKESFPGLKIAGAHHGYFTSSETDRIIASINAAKPDILLVAYGVPVQEIWLAENASKIDAPVTLGVGGLFDFLSGRIPRAPKLLRKTGLEWTYRLYQEPVRMWRRYVIGNPLFLGHAISDALSGPLNKLRRSVDETIRRTIDIAGAGAGLTLLSPLLAATALKIRLESAGPAIFKQTRIGQDGTPFTMYKFRSMTNDAEKKRRSLDTGNNHGANGVTFKIKNDPRITPFGHFIRKYSIDELPQLWNVFVGDMSLVGPRPALPQEVERYSSHQWQRLAVKPGITCIWQIAGRANIDFEGQVALDLKYIRERNIFNDLSILLRTPFAVIAARGAY